MRAPYAARSGGSDEMNGEAALDSMTMCVGTASASILGPARSSELASSDYPTGSARVVPLVALR